MRFPVLKILALLCSTIGALAVVGVAAFALYALLQGGSEATVFALFIALVFGLPAVGFAFLMFTLAGVFGAAGVVSNQVSQSTPEDESYNPNPLGRQLAPKYGKTLLITSYCLFGFAVLWSVPYGFLTFVEMVTSFAGQATDEAIKWLGIAAPAVALGFVARRFAYLGNDI